MMMISLCNAIRKILSGCTDCCGLCFESCTEVDGLYNLQDEIILQSGGTVKISEIVFTLLGRLTLESLSFNKICQKCARAAISSYNFINMCTANIKHLVANLNSLQLTINNTIDVNECYKSLFLALDINNYTTNIFYNVKESLQTEMSPQKTFHFLQRLPYTTNVNLITLDIEVEPDNCDIHEDYMTKKVNRRQAVQSVQLSDIPYEIDNENNYKCTDCSKIYPTVLKIKQHYLRVHAPKDFKCLQCPKSFGSSLLLNRHTKDSHCTVVCSQCGKIYTNTYSLRHHERSHRLRLICQTCGKVYKGKQAFNNHINQKLCEKMRKSNAEAKFTCDYCGKRYSQKTALSVHIRLEHENGKAVMCDWCGKKLSSTSRLKDHILKHTKQKNFYCDICGGKFVTKASLLYHTRTHTGEKPYKCDHCEMRFLSASRRSEHVQRHHTRPDLECDICHGKFKGQTCLTRHRKRHFDVSSRLYHNGGD